MKSLNYSFHMVHVASDSGWNLSVLETFEVTVIDTMSKLGYFFHSIHLRFVIIMSVSTNASQYSLLGISSAGVLDGQILITGGIIISAARQSPLLF